MGIVIISERRWNTLKKRLAALIALLLAALVLAEPLQARTAGEAPSSGETPGALRQTAPVTILVDGEPVDFGNAGPVIEQDRTLAPAAPLFEKLNIRLEESPVETEDAGGQEPAADTTALVVGTKLGLVAVFQPDAPEAFINGETVELPVPARHRDGQLYIPVRLVAEAAGYNVGWDADSRTVTLVRRTGGKGFIWEVRSDTATVYLVGSIHMADERLYPLPPSFEEAFDAAEAIGFEVDLRNALSPEGLQLSMQAVQLTDGTTLRDHVSAETYQLLTERLAELGFPENALDSLKPWAAAQFLANAAMADIGIVAAQGIEMVFLMGVEARQLPVFELESLAFQLELFDRFSPELQERQLLESLQADKGLEQLAAFLDAWVAGDDAMLAQRADASKEEDEEYYRLMLAERNHAMAEKIRAILDADESPVSVIVVGALHMLGEDGIVTLLEKDGYTVIRR